MLQKTLALVLMCVILLSTVNASVAESSEHLDTWLCEERQTLTIGVQESAVVEDWETNGQTLLLEKELNLDLKFVLLPADDAEFRQKIELMAMSGSSDLPDIIISYNVALNDQTLLKNLADLGMIIPVTQYYKTLAKYTTESVIAGGHTMEERLAYVTNPDGEIYGLWGYLDTLHSPYTSDMTFVYKPWLDKLGLDIPTTTEEFKAALIAIRDNDLDGDGDPTNEIPYLSYKNLLGQNQIRFLMNPFIYTQDSYVQFNPDTQQVELVANTDEWREGIRWVKSLYDEGLYTSVSMTQDQTSFNATVVAEPETVGFFGRISSTNLPASDIRRTEYYLCNPLIGPNGQQNATNQPRVPYVAMVITSQCKDPELAFKFGDYLNSEHISIWSRYGEYGVDWTDPDEGSTGTFEAMGYGAKLKTITNWGILQNKWWGQWGPTILNGEWGSGQQVVDAPGSFASSSVLAIGNNLQTWIDHCNPYPIYALVYNEEEQEIINEWKSVVNDYILSSWCEFVTGIRDIETGWDEYLAEFDRMDMDSYLGAITSCYLRMFGNK